jgi:murein L,D-transpeptidase YcbB/YkuD
MTRYRILILAFAIFAFSSIPTFAEEAAAPNTQTTAGASTGTAPEQAEAPVSAPKIPAAAAAAAMAAENQEPTANTPPSPGPSDTAAPASSTAAPATPEGSPSATPAAATEPAASPSPAAPADAAAAATSTPSPDAASPSPDTTAPAAAAAATPPVPENPVIAAVRQKLAAAPADTSDQPLVAEQDKKERDALSAFYAARTGGPLWASEKGLTDKGLVAVSEIENADAWGLSPNDIAVPDAATTNAGTGDLQTDAIADLEVKVGLAVLKYARYARGGRIMDPTTMLDSNLDRKPQLVDPKTVLDEIANAAEPDAYLRGLNPKQPQFEKLRQAYLSMRPVPKGGAKLAASGADLAPGAKDAQVAALRHRLGLRAPVAAAGETGDDVYGLELKDAVVAFQEAHGIAADGIVNAATRAALIKKARGDDEKLLANMEEWRWMWPDLGDMHIIANVPEFMMHLYKNGEVVHSERIVAGEVGKQTTIFTRTLKEIVFRPMWRVPESIKVKELWPNLLRGGGMFAQYGLQMQTKSGEPVDFRRIDWSKTDIRNYEVVQPPGRKSVLGVVKFSFPSQHTIYMHDTPDKWMFAQKQRTLSHGCLRLRNPVRLADLVLAEDKGWDKAHIAELIKSGPLNNAIAIEKKIPIHLTYFTAWVDDKGTVRTYADVYGHEKRIRLALEGKWSKIVKGRDHLKPVEPDLSAASRVAQSGGGNGSKRAQRTPSDFIGSALGSLF